ncbi:unnamed protein product [Dovyalis caffra]|uniref:Uncharacterized protein n=1 Tax=Dovyalis caffra TaxID=77055 RepID=A0AAV1SD16_9ROSI|nr:unnamed protein product [Dovyalis caffra]
MLKEVLASARMHPSGGSLDKFNGRLGLGLEDRYDLEAGISREKMQAIKDKLNDMSTMRKVKAEAKAEEKAEKEMAKTRMDVAHEVRLAKEAEGQMELHVAKAEKKIEREIAKHELDDGNIDNNAFQNNNINMDGNVNNYGSQDYNANNHGAGYASQNDDCYYRRGTGAPADTTAASAASYTTANHGAASFPHNERL